MRIYKTEEFARLPSGTVFGMFPPSGSGMCGDVCVLDQAVPPIDFLYRRLAGLNTDVVCVARFEAERGHFMDFPADHAVHLYGRKDADELFLVYDLSELRRMEDYLVRAQRLIRDREA